MKKITLFLLVISGIFIYPIVSIAQHNTAPQNNPQTLKDIATPHSEADKVELFQKMLASQRIAKTVKQVTGATKEEMQMFRQFYTDSLMRDKAAFNNAVKNGRIASQYDVKLYADKKTPEYVAMFRRFQRLRRDAPTTVDEVMHPSAPPVTCVSGCNNLDFENGSLAAWTACYAANTSTSSGFATSAFTCFGPLAAVTVAAYDPSTSSNQVSLTSGAGFDPIAGALIPVVAPGGGSYSCEVGDGTGSNYGVAMIEQTWTVLASQPNFTYMYAVMLENPVHPYYFQPYFEVELLDQSGNPIPGCGQYDVVSAPGLPAFTPIYYPTDGDTVYAKQWSSNFVSLNSYIGTCVTIKVISSDCGYGAHFGYGYFDALCSPQTVISSSPAICGSSNVTLTAPSGAATYQWLGPCIIGPNNQQTVTVNCAGTYSVILVSNIHNPCPDTLKTTITVSPVLNFNTVSQTNIACFGGITGSSTNIASGGTPPYTYSWSPAHGTNATATGLSAGTYTAYATDNAGCKDSLVITITQPPALVATATFTPTSCSGNTGSTSVTVTGGTPNYIYSWAPTGNTNATETGLSSGTYTITVTDANGCTTTGTTTIAAVNGLTVNTTVTNLLCFGSSTGIANATPVGGTGPFIYAWTPAGGSNASATGLSAGTYTVSVTDANGCSGTALAIISQPTAITATTSATQTPCGGNTGTTTVTAGGGTPNYTYLWTPSAQTNATATGLTAGIYAVTITDANGCTQTATVAVTTTTALNVSATFTNILCNGSSTGTITTTTSGGTAPYAYTWSPSGGTNANASGLSAGTYVVSVMDVNGCTGTTTATITQPAAILTTTLSSATSCVGNTGTATVIPTGGTPAYTYLWTPSGNTSATATGLSAGVYNVSVTDANNCNVTATATVTQPNALVVTTTSTASTCTGNTGTATAIVSGGTPAYTYAWTSGGTNATATGLSAGTYTVTITDAAGCTQTATAIVTVPQSQPLVITASGAKSFCGGGGSATLSASASGGDGIYSYLWLPVNNTSLTITVSPTSSTTYTIQVTDGCGNLATNVVTVSINPSPSVGFVADPYSGCAPLCVQFRDLSSIPGGSISQWRWNFGDGDSTTGKYPIHCYSAPGTYNVDLTVISDSGCSSSLQIVNMITVYPSPIANFTYSPQPVNITQPLVQFTDNSSSKYPIIYWTWYFGDGTDSVSTLENPSHQYSDTGTYCAKLIVMDEHGCVDTATNCLVVDPMFTLYIPDGFTPNGDGVNDVFMAKGSYIKDFEMYIFDRWGEKLFYSNNIMNGWNGSLNNSSTICQEDTYVYQINLTDTKGNKHAYNGKVTLIK